MNGRPGGNPRSQPRMPQEAQSQVQQISPRPPPPQPSAPSQPQQPPRPQASHSRVASQSTRGPPTKQQLSTTSLQQSQHPNKRQSLTSSQVPNIAELSITPQRTLASRPKQHGVRGTPVSARANFFKIETSCLNFIAYKYENTEDLGRLSKNRIMRRCASLLLQQYPQFKHAATNYVNLFYAPAEHPIVENNQREALYTVDYYEPEESGPRQNPNKLRIPIRLAEEATFSVGDLVDHLQCTSPIISARISEFIAMFNAFLDRPISENSSMTTLARRTKFFDLAAKDKQDLGNGLEARKGFFKSVRDCDGSFYLNLNSSAGAFFKALRLDELIKQMGVSISVGHKLKGARVFHKYSGVPQVKTIAGLAPSWKPDEPPFAQNVRFDCPKHNRNQETVADHFLTAYPNVVRPNLNALTIDLGNKVYVPSDLLTMMPGQPFKGALSSDQTSAMIKFACRLPSPNKDLIIKEGIPAFKWDDLRGPKALFGVSLAGASQPQMIQVHARRLPAPSLCYGYKNEKLATKFQGDYAKGSWNLAEKKFFRGPSEVHVVTYLELQPEKSCKNLRNFITGIQSGLVDYFQDQNPKWTEAVDRSEHVIKIQGNPQKLNVSALDKALREKFQQFAGLKFSLVFVILPGKNVELYSLVKRVADTVTGIHTICTVCKQQLVKTKPQEIANLMLKCNQKLGGVNHTFQLPKDHDDKVYDIVGPMTAPAMFVGADVTHPSPVSMIGAPSIAAVVASYEQSFTHYPGSVHLQNSEDEQKKAVEMIQTLGEMIKSRLHLYRSKNTGKLPERIVYIRDGVSDGQFAQVMAEEIEGSNGLEAGVKSFYKHYGFNYPKFLVIVAQKRHHTRFYQDPSKMSPAFDAKGNPLPGFTVDRTIVSPNNFDWYTTSHASIQGTSRPAKYVVLRDDIGVSADTIQQLMFHMCYTMGRATRSIGIHPAARYADLLCDRARFYLRDVYAPPLSAGPRPTYSPKNGHWAGGIAAKLRDSMFYI